MKNFIFHHGLSGEEVKDPLPELGFIPRSGSKNAKNSIFQRILDSSFVDLPCYKNLKLPKYAILVTLDES
ncbi:MAG: hypothetical protein ACKO3R_09015 [bacterium]